MKKKSTTELLNELSGFSSFKEYEAQNKNHMINKTIAEYLNDLISERNMTKAQVIRRGELGESYAYQLFSGLKDSPARDKLICVSIGLLLNVEETNSLLKLGGHLPLYPRSKRDSIIIIGINNNKGVAEINEELFDNAEVTLN